MSGSGPDRAITGRCLHPGVASAPLLVLDEPLSLWGGVDENGTVCDVHHPQHGRSVSGRIVSMPFGRGSSSSSTVLAELLRSGRGPAALLLSECDTILVTGALVAAEMYGGSLPIVELSEADRGALALAFADGASVAVRADVTSGTAEVTEERG